MSYSGDMEGCHACGQRTDGRNVKIGLEFWKQNSQYRNMYRNVLDTRQMMLINICKMSMMTLFLLDKVLPQATVLGSDELRKVEVQKS